MLRTGSPKRLGFLAIYEEPKVPRAGRPICVAMRKKGWVLGENLLVEPAYADWKAERLAGLAEQLVRSRVDIIFAADPYGRPGRNVTGQTVYTGIEVASKRLEFPIPGEPLPSLVA